MLNTGLTKDKLTQLVEALDGAGWNIESLDIIRDADGLPRGALDLQLIEKPEDVPPEGNQE
jgi:hypothetical protein